MYIVCTQNYVCTFLFLLLHAKYNCLLASYHFPAASVLLIISFETVFLNIMLHSGRKLEKIMLFSFKLNNKVSQLVHQRWPTLTFFIDILRSFLHSNRNFQRQNKELEFPTLFSTFIRIELFYNYSVIFGLCLAIF